MRTTPDPVLAILDLWSLGHSAGDIARRMGLPNHKRVTRIVAQARAIRDRRAVLHRAKGGRLLGRFKHNMELIERWPEIEIVDSLTYACGHVYLGDGRCRQCVALRDRGRKR